ncbi:hypothetical protein L596_020081 [Steinernema carpocapsae]|uniref:Uncharacterized protein n=1 Tax=Steinernema carpocapsae TaxID=34508 RepID=A0A4U5MSP3_STECR|nr:hypothetical protein L596_020081 [Steinernema carpocapsae]
MNVLAARKRDEQFTLTLPNMSSFRFPELKERLELFPLDTQISSVHIIQQCEFNKDEMNEYTREKVFEATCKFKEILMLYDWTNFQQFANLCLQERAEIIQVDFGHSINETNLASLFTNLWSLFQSTEISFSITIKSFLCIEETLWDRLNQLPHYDTEGYIRGRRYKIRVFEVDHPTLGDQFKMAFTVNLDRKEHGMYCTERVVFE